MIGQICGNVVIAQNCQTEQYLQGLVKFALIVVNSTAHLFGGNVQRKIDRCVKVFKCNVCINQHILEIRVQSKKVEKQNWTSFLKLTWMIENLYQHRD